MSKQQQTDSGKQAVNKVKCLEVLTSIIKIMKQKDSQ